jgi:alpha-L-rhamnosidase
MPGDLNWVKASYRSVSGLISSDWRRDKGIFMLNVSIPANTSARVYVPAKQLTDVRESGSSTTNVSSLKLVNFENGRAVFELGSGDYKFSSFIE